MEKKFISELKNSNKVALIKSEIQNYANNVGAVLGFLQSLPESVEDFESAKGQLDIFLDRWCEVIDEKVNALRATTQDTKPEV